MATKNIDNYKYYIKETLRPSSLLAIFLGFLGILLFVIGLSMIIKSRKTAPVGQITDQAAMDERSATADDLKSPEPEQNQNGEETTYTVTPGDSTWSIAEHFYGDGNKYTLIESANGLYHDQWLDNGMVLKIPKMDQSADKLSKQDETNLEDVYTVVSGDSLWFISLKYLDSGYEWPRLYAANQTEIGANPDLIYPGQKLVLPNRR